MNSPKIAIIGGGPGGLMTAYYLQKRSPVPWQITIFEADKRLGGKIMTEDFALHGVPYEAGAAELYDYSHLGPDPLRELVEELGLQTLPMSGGTVVLDDKILQNYQDICQILGSDTGQALKNFNRKARSLITPSEYYESDWKEDNADPLSRKSFYDLMAGVTNQDARRYIEVAIHSDLACEPHQTNAMYGLQNYLMDELDYMRLYTIVGGIERLPRELAKRLQVRILLNQAVTRVELTSTKQYRVTSRILGENRQEDFDFVVAALPNNWLPAITWGGKVLAEAMHRHHEYYDYPAHYLRVSLLFERPFWRKYIKQSFFMIDAFGGCCVYDESSRSNTGSYGVLGWLLAGEAAVNMNNYADSTLAEKMLDTLPTSLRHGMSLFREVRVHRWVGSVNALPAGCPAKDPDTRHVPEPTEHPGLFVVGDYLFDSTLNGVLDSADTVVEWLLDEIKEEPAVQVDGRSGDNTASQNQPSTSSLSSTSS